MLAVREVPTMTSDTRESLIALEWNRLKVIEAVAETGLEPKRRVASENQ
jgi:hypothetical protein